METGEVITILRDKLIIKMALDEEDGIAGQRQERHMEVRDF